MKHIPNVLSVLRILMIPFFIWQFQKGNGFNATIILMVSAATDMLDGFLARTFNWQSKVGQILDPVADKLTLISVSIVLALALKQYRILFIIILCKDALMIILGGFFLKKGVEIHGAKWFGKITTVLFYLTMISIGLFPNMPETLRTILIIVVTIAEVTAAALYFPDLKKYIESSRNKQK